MSLVVPNGKNKRKIGAFSYCVSLSDFAMGENVSCIGSSAFEGCSSLTTITIPESVEEIGQAAFFDCTGLTAIYFNAISIEGDSDFYNIFANAGIDGDGLTLVFGDNVRIVPRSMFNDVNGQQDASGLKEVVFGNSIQKIGDYAFYHCSNLKNVIFPASLREIGERAFYDCSSFTTIVLPDGVEKVGDMAFGYCVSVTDVKFPEGADLGEGVLEGCDLIKNAVGDLKIALQLRYTVVNLTVTGEGEIEQGTFASNKNLVNLTIGDKVTSIGESAFNNCEKLESVVIGNGVEFIGDYAFFGCDNLKSLTVGKSVKKIGGHAFGYCLALSEIYFNAIEADDLSYGDDAFVFSGSQAEKTTLIFGDEVVKIPAYLCYYASHISEILFGSNVKIIGENAFNGCTKLTNLTIPDSVTEIGTRAFDLCNNVESVDLPALALPAIRNMLNNGKIKTVVVTSGQSIGEEAFSGCYSLTSVWLPAGIIDIGEMAFSGCRNLSEINVAAKNTRYTVKSNCLIETATKTLIAGCKTSIIPSDGSVTAIADNAFRGSGLTTIVIPDNVTAIGSFAFLDSYSLESVTIGKDVVEIGNSVFLYCPVENVTFLNSFGHGVSYTEFEYNNFTVTDNGDGTLTAKVTVTNTGDWSGKEVVELYAQTPYSDYDKENGIEKSSVELVGYAKTALLAPEASEEVTITVDKELLAAYDAQNAKTYIMDAGDYYLTFGNGAHDALNAIIAQREETEGLTAVDERIVAASDPVYYTGTQRVYHWTEEFDNKTYSTSSVTGAEITNQFDFADINKYSGKGDNSVEYVSRSDWMGTFDVTSLDTMKATNVKLSMTDQMFKELTNTWYEPAADASTYEMPTMGKSNGLTLAMFVGVGLDETVKLEDKNGVVHEYTWDDLLDQMTYNEMATLVLNGQHQTAAISSISKPGTKDENGPSGFNVTFVGGGGSGTAYPAPCMRAATWNQELVERVGELIGEDGMAAGKNGIYGPAANTHRNAYGGRNFEYYSEDPFISSTIGGSECKGIQSKGIIVYEKHFALNDSETHREGTGTWANEQAIREIYLEAFRGIMSSDQGNAHATMSGFNRLGTKWCGSSTELMNNVLRGEWGFDGFVATDMDNCNANVLCTGYMYAPAAITGGTDIYDGAGNPLNHNRKTQLSEYKNDPYVMTKLREACQHIIYAVANSAAMNGVSTDSTIRNITPWWQATLIAVTVVFAFITAVAVLMWVLNAKGIIQFPKPKADKNNDQSVDIKVE